MALTLPKWLLGKHITAISVAPCTVNAITNVVTAATGTGIGSLRGRVDSVRLVNRTTDEIIKSVDSKFANHVVVDDDMELELTEILVTAATGANLSVSAAPLLPLLPTLADLFLITFGRGGQTYSLYMTRGTMSEGVTAAGKNTATMTFGFADVRDSTLVHATNNPLGQVGMPYADTPA